MGVVVGVAFLYVTGYECQTNLSAIHSKKHYLWLTYNTMLRTNNSFSKKNSCGGWAGWRRAKGEKLGQL